MDHEHRRREEHGHHHGEDRCHEGHGHHHGGHEHHHEERCGCGCEDGMPQDPTEFMVRTWQNAFEEAAHQVQVEALKERLKKVWGKQLNDIADSVIKLVLKDWEDAMGRKTDKGGKEKAYRELVEKIDKAFRKGPK